MTIKETITYLPAREAFLVRYADLKEIFDFVTFYDGGITLQEIQHARKRATKLSASKFRCPELEITIIP